MSNIILMDHPLIQHKIGLLRRKETGTRDFRDLISEIAMLECYEATRHLALGDVEIETPVAKATVKELQGKKLAIVPIRKGGRRPQTGNRSHPSRRSRNGGRDASDDPGGQGRSYRALSGFRIA